MVWDAPGMHPHGSALQAITDLGYSYPDYMHVVADSVRIDLARGKQVTAIPTCHEPRSSAGMPVAGRRNPQIPGCPHMSALAIFLRTRGGAENLGSYVTAAKGRNGGWFPAVGD